MTLYNEGDRVEMVSMGDDPDPILPGTKGTVTHYTKCFGFDQLGVVWDNGRALSVIFPEDEVRKI